MPNPANPQSWNRFSYVVNNPIRYSDPTGHYLCEGIDCQLPTSPIKDKKSSLINFDGDGWDDDAKNTIIEAAEDMGNRMSWIINERNRLICKMEGNTNCLSSISAEEVFLKLFDGPITFTRVGKTCAERFGNPEYGCWGMAAGSNVFTFSNAPNMGIAEQPQWAVHEMFHIFDVSVTGQAGRNFVSQNPVLLGRSGLDYYPWRQSVENINYEAFADTGIAWTYNHWVDTAAGIYASQLMGAFMTENVLETYYNAQ